MISFYLLWEPRITARFAIRAFDICSVLWSRLFQFGVILAGSESKLVICVGISKEVEKLQFSWLDTRENEDHSLLLDSGISYSQEHIGYSMLRLLPSFLINLSLRVQWNEVLGITNDYFYPTNSKMYEKEPRYNET